MTTMITHFLAFCLGAWVCASVLLHSKKSGSSSPHPAKASPLSISQGGVNTGQALDQLGAVSKQVFTDENIKQMQNVMGQVIQQIPQMAGVIAAQKGVTPAVVNAPKVELPIQDSELIALKKQLEQINQSLGVSGITEAEVRSLLTQEHLDATQKKLMEQFLELNRKLSEMKN